MPQSQQLTIQQAISRAKKATKQGNTAVAVNLYNAVLQQEPNHPIAKKRLNKLQKELPHDRSAQAQTTQPSPVQIDALVNLYQTGQMAKVELACGKLLKSYPQSLAVINILGAAFQGQGKLQEAVQAYDKAIRLKPDFAEAHSNRGNALGGMGRLDEAVESYDKAIQLKPDFADAYSNLGNALKDLGLLEEAVESYDKAIQLKPDYAEPYNNKGIALGQLGQLQEAVESYNKAIQFKPDYAEAHNNKGGALKDLGLLEEAVESYNKAIQLKPDYAEPYNNKGIALGQLGQLQEAVESYNKAIQFKPDYAKPYNNKGIALGQLGQLQEAVESYNKAIQFKPDYAEPYNNKGIALGQLGQLQEAVESYNKAIQFKPDYAKPYNNKGIALGQLGQLQEAVESYNKAIQFKPDYAEPYNNKGIALGQLGQLQEAVESYNKAIQFKPDYAEAHNNKGGALKDLGLLDEALKSFDKAIQLKPDFSGAYSNLLMCLNYIPNLNVMDYLATARKFGELVTEKVKTHFSDYQCLPVPKKLRVGLVSGDLWNHPIGYFLESVLSSMDPSKIELIAYSTTPKVDDLSERIKPFFSVWNPIYGKTDEAAAKLIYEDGVHVLLDLSGHTSDNRLPMFGYKPAPVQVSWLGYFATTGLNEMDYLIGDPHVTPPKDDGHFTEKVWRLPETRWCFTPPNANAEVSVSPAVKHGYVTFGCFNNITKVNDKVVSLWTKVLEATPNSRLLLKAKQFDDQLVRESIIQRFAAQGINSKRIFLEGKEDRQKYFAAYNKIDITLDPFPFTGGTTSVESLWMGVPLVTLAGNTLVSRQGVGVLINAGLSDWVAEDEEEYVAKTVLFASDLDKLAILRTGLRSQVLASPLFDAPRFARNFENALLEMWNQRDRQR